jgi:formyl-CoA transferase
VITQAQAFPALAKIIGHADWLEDPEFNTPEARLPKLDFVFAEIEKWTMTMSKMDVMAKLNAVNVPCGPILSMKEIAEEPALRNTGTVVEVDHPTRSSFRIPLPMSGAHRCWVSIPMRFSKVFSV